MDVLLDESSTLEGSKPLVVGISGVTCGGKTTLSKLLQATFPWGTVVHQDAYFFPNDPKYHVYLPEIDYFNWELETALDFERMENDVRSVLLKGKTMASHGTTPFFDNMDFVRAHHPTPGEAKHFTNQFSSVPLIILEGHILFNRQFFNQICDHKFFLTLSKGECCRRRQSRVYDPMPPPRFFDKCVWPSYEGRFMNVKYLGGINFIDAEKTNLVDIYHHMKTTIVESMSKIKNNTSCGKMAGQRIVNF